MIRGAIVLLYMSICGSSSCCTSNLVRPWSWWTVRMYGRLDEGRPHPVTGPLYGNEKLTRLSNGMSVPISSTMSGSLWKLSKPNCTHRSWSQALLLLSAGFKLFSQSNLVQNSRGCSNRFSCDFRHGNEIGRLRSGWTLPGLALFPLGLRRHIALSIKLSPVLLPTENVGNNCKTWMFSSKLVTIVIQ